MEEKNFLENRINIVDIDEEIIIQNENFEEDLIETDEIEITNTLLYNVPDNIGDNITTDVIVNCFYISIPIFLSLLTTIILTRLIKMSLNVGKKV